MVVVFQWWTERFAFGIVHELVTKQTRTDEYPRAFKQGAEVPTTLEPRQLGPFYGRQGCMYPVFTDGYPIAPHPTQSSYHRTVLPE